MTKLSTHTRTFADRSSFSTVNFDDSRLAG